MAIGAGKYDAQATTVREETNAQAVVVIVLGGNKGSGFSVQALSEEPHPTLLAEVLEEIAKEIRRAATS